LVSYLVELVLIWQSDCVVIDWVDSDKRLRLVILSPIVHWQCIYDGDAGIITYSIFCLHRFRGAAIVAALAASSISHRLQLQ